MTDITTVTVVVQDYDQAIAYYTRCLGFTLIEDHELGGGKRWVRVAPRGSRAMTLLLAQASTPEQSAHVGNQTGGRVAFFLQASDFWAQYERMRDHDVAFTEEPRHESYGWVVVFEDLYGNKWDLVHYDEKET